MKCSLPVDNLKSKKMCYLFIISQKGKNTLKQQNKTNDHKEIIQYV